MQVLASLLCFLANRNSELVRFRHILASQLHNCLISSLNCTETKLENYFNELFIFFQVKNIDNFLIAY